MLHNKGEAVVKLEVYDILKRLSDARGISGYEGDVSDVVKELAEPYCDSIRVDTLGNLVCTVNGGKPEVMLATHMDEIGLVVKFIEENGFLRFTRMGGWFDQTLRSQRVVIRGKKGDVWGVIGCKPPHVMKEEERKSVVSHEDMFIDVGASSREDVEMLGIEVGSPVVMDRELIHLSGSRVSGKALDNRSGVATGIHVLSLLQEREVDATIHFVATVQEEVGLKGAKTSAYGINPDVALVVDVTIAGDHPGISLKEAPIEVGKGPAICMVDGSGRGTITHPQVVKWLKDTASRHYIPFQLDVSEGGTTDAAVIHLTRDGIPTGTLSIPSRYIHTPVEVIDMLDVEYTSKLVARAIERVGEYF